MPNADEIYASSGNFMKGEAFKDADPVTLTIASVEIRDFNRDDGKVQRRAVLSFEETDERLVLNNTNRLMVQENAGSTQTEQWPGTKVTLHGAKATFGNRLFDVIRVAPPSKKSTGKTPKIAVKEHKTPSADEDFDEPIPF